MGENNSGADQIDLSVFSWKGTAETKKGNVTQEEN
jgi:hypothetical protein